VDGEVSEAAFLATFSTNRPQAGRRTVVNILRFALHALGWPDAEQPNREFDETTEELVVRPWAPGEYAAQATFRVLSHLAHAAALPERENNFRVAMDREFAAQVELLRDVVGNPFTPVAFDPAWRTDTAVSLARQMYDAREFSAMPILADALQDAGCENEDVLTHCRGPGPHVRGCWVVDGVLGKE
jgi:hypothetical protein